ncbi:hypothetical protein FQZ97_1098410 [compost metagenome]
MLQLLYFSSRLDTIRIGIKTLNPKVRRHRTERHNDRFVRILNARLAHENMLFRVNADNFIEHYSNIIFSCKNLTKRYPRLGVAVTGSSSVKRRIILKIRLVADERNDVCRILGELKGRLHTTKTTADNCYIHLYPFLFVYLM